MKVTRGYAEYQKILKAVKLESAFEKDVKLLTEKLHIINTQGATNSVGSQLKLNSEFIPHELVISSVKSLKSKYIQLDKSSSDFAELNALWGKLCTEVLDYTRSYLPSNWQVVSGICKHENIFDKCVQKGSIFPEELSLIIGKFVVQNSAQELEQQVLGQVSEAS